MATYLIESYEPMLTPDGLRHRTTDADAAAASMRHAGFAVRALEATLVITDETCFLAVEAPSKDDALALAEAAGIAVGRVTEVVRVPCARESREARG